jgi:hypothetical protein
MAAFVMNQSVPSSANSPVSSPEGPRSRAFSISNSGQINPYISEGHPLAEALSQNDRANAIATSRTRLWLLRLDCLTI